MVEEAHSWKGRAVLGCSQAAAWVCLRCRRFSVCCRRKPKPAPSQLADHEWTPEEPAGVGYGQRAPAKGWVLRLPKVWVCDPVGEQYLAAAGTA